VTPEAVAKHIAVLCGKVEGVVLDGFAGVGGNSIQFALFKGGPTKGVVSVEKDPEKARCIAKNCKVYKAEERVQVLCKDLFAVLPEFQAGLVFLSPPWGGPKYKEAVEFVLMRSS